jgi:hypothetical protein
VTAAADIAITNSINNVSGALFGASATGAIGDTCQVHATADARAALT